MDRLSVHLSAVRFEPDCPYSPVKGNVSNDGSVFLLQQCHRGSMSTGYTM